LKILAFNNCLWFNKLCPKGKGQKNMETKDLLESIYESIKALVDHLEKNRLTLSDEQQDDLQNLIFDLKMLSQDYKKK
jgi:hypothetical protein